MVSLWVLFAPQQFGGSTTYVIVAGDSMTPNYLLGDLVIVREQAAYRVGDAVTYEHPEIGYVFHRIVDVDEEGRFVMQGDHNSWQDQYHPSTADVIGKLWLHVPKVGKPLESLRSPWGFAILTLFFTAIIFSVVVPPEKTRGRRKARGRSNPMSGTQQHSAEILFILAVLTLGMLVLGIAAFRQPLFNEIHTPLAYEQQAVFRYTAKVPSGVYDSTQIEPGEPIFRRLNGSFNIGMDYLFITTHPNTVSGTYRLIARVSDDSGWKRTLELTPETSFNGNVFTVSADLALDNIQRFIDTLEKETGVERGRYTLTIQADIRTTGMVSELPLDTTFTPQIYFDVTNLEVVLRKAPNPDQDVLNPIQKGSLTRVSMEQNVLHLLGIQLPVYLARWIALLVGIPATLWLIILLTGLYTSTQHSELERVRVWYGKMLIEARNIQLLDSPSRVEIASIDDLANLAEQDQRAILHLPDGNMHHFFVQTAEQLYHYQMEENAHRAEVLPAENQHWSFRLPWQQHSMGQPSSYTRALEGWAQAVDMRFYEEGHSQEVAEITEELARALGLRGRALEEVRLGAYLHDIGLMHVPDTIYYKKNKLTKKEWEVMRSHPEQAKENLLQANLQTSVVDIVYYHHERWDGSGYPAGMMGEEIPLGARIVAVTDVWYALKHPRPYREAWSLEEICQFFREQAGVQFDPHIVEVFLDLLSEKYPDECGAIVNAEVEVTDAA